MADRHQELAQKVVNTFKQSLSDQARDQITDAQFNELVLMIREAISEELKDVAELIDGIAKRLRSQTDDQELGL
jgi:uncharacterized protein with von Willebrand factor type A (vWA) domain